MERKKISLNIEYIKTIHYSVNYDCFNVTASMPLTIEHNKLIFRTNSKIDYNLDDSLIIIEIELNIIYENSTICSLKCAHGYAIENLKDLIIFDNNDRKIFSAPYELLIPLLSASHSATRGILFEKNCTTLFCHFFFPPVDARTLIPEKSEKLS
ncbi:hypothetical protein BH10BAC5_BH10BAC5_21270 [soil metagenome]